MSHAVLPARRAALTPRDPSPSVAAAAECFLAAGGGRGRLGVVLGTGLGGLAERLDGLFSMPSVETGFLPPSTATGHAGRVVSGTLGGVPVVGLQGRVHGYEGVQGEQLCRGVGLLAELGVERLLLTNAAGGLDGTMRPGDIVVLHDHLDWVRSEATVAAEAGPRLSRCRGPIYDPGLVDQTVAAAAHCGFRCRSGVYVYVSGPTYETRAEYRMFRRLGGDVVGMSTVPEAVWAWRRGLQVTAASVVTNVAKPDAAMATDPHEVCDAAAAAADGVWAILHSLAASLPVV